MRKNHNLMSDFWKELSNEVSTLRSWFQGIWSSLKRFIRRSLYPNRGRRQGIPTNQSQICPLTGVSQFHHSESLKVGDLMAKVQWRVPKQPKKTALSNVASVREEINWD